ncbi:MAG: tRNA (guanosine(46)-N7)-methyltransferase TrmB [Planctomycetales bacterium]
MLDLRPWFLTLHDLDGVVDFAKLFGNDRPVELDVGCGRGLFLVNAAVEHPEVNYLGIELDYREGRHSAKKLQKRRLPNARVWGGDANAALDDHIAPASVAAVHVYFPDPWWKRRHRRRRLFTDVFVERIACVLKPGGIVHVWTDVGEYFEVMRALMDHSERFEPVPPPVEKPAEHDLDYRTSFERKRRQSGCAIHRGRWRRK